MAVSDIISSIKTRMNTVLPNGYEEIGYSTDVNKNSFKGNAKKYGVVPQGADQVDGNLRTVTLDHVFQLLLTDMFINKPMDDSSEQTVKSTLQDLVLSVYKDLVTTKCGSNSSVLLVAGLSIDNPETIDGQFVVQRASFTIKYRTSF